MHTGTDLRVCLPRPQPWLAALAALCLLVVPQAGWASGSAGEPYASPETAPPTPARFQVRAYALKGDPLLTGGNFSSVLAPYTGTNLAMTELVDAASRLQLGYRSAGHTNVTITLGQSELTNGTAVLHVFRGALPQVVVDGKRVAMRTEAELSAAARSARRGTPAKGASAKVKPGFLVRAYAIHGDTLLTVDALTKVLAKYTGTNVTVADIIKAGTSLQMEYRDRGFPTVKVAIPPQRLDTNGIVKVEVVEGRLAEVNVVNNRFFSTPNILRALPSLHTNTILLGPVFQAELDRANANQDRQIYPELEPGPTEGTSILDLKVKDRLPLHAKVEFDNQNSPGTPDLRLNTSAVYNNLWQLEHSLGVQYAFSPTDYKTGNQWDLYDLPQVANYGAFYRLPLGNPEPISQELAANPGSFGYDEATRKFRLPPPTGQAELSLYASRSTIDTGVTTLSSKTLTNTPALKLSEDDVQQDLTVNDALGFRLTAPLPSSSQFRSGFAFGADYKNFELTSFRTNIFTEIDRVPDQNSGSTTPKTNIYQSVSPTWLPTAVSAVEYLPVTLHYSGTLQDKLGVTGFGLGLTANSWYSGSRSNLQAITGSSRSSGFWLVLNPSLSRDLTFCKGWTLSLNASGQWADEPLISNEQFGVGGVGSVRGYHEGEAFGNDGWWATAEQKTPPYVVGNVYTGHLLTVRGSVFTGYGQAFSLAGHQDLWGAGFGGSASVGANWEARLLFSWPFISTPYTRAGQPRFDFALSAQF